MVKILDLKWVIGLSVVLGFVVGAGVTFVGLAAAM